MGWFGRDKGQDAHETVDKENKPKLTKLVRPGMVMRLMVATTIEKANDPLRFINGGWCHSLDHPIAWSSMKPYLKLMDHAGVMDLRVKTHLTALRMNAKSRYALAMASVVVDRELEDTIDWQHTAPSALFIPAELAGGWKAFTSVGGINPMAMKVMNDVALMIAMRIHSMVVDPKGIYVIYINHTHGENADAAMVSRLARECQET